MSISTPARRVPIEPQSVDAPLTGSAVFLVLTVVDTPDAYASAKAALGSVSGVQKNVAFRDLGACLSCTIGIGSRIWDVVTARPRPAELHDFRPVCGVTH